MVWYSGFSRRPRAPPHSELRGAPIRSGAIVDVEQDGPRRYLESVEVKETFEGKTVWQGAVKLFALTGHPSGATRAYAWSYPTGRPSRMRFSTIISVATSSEPTAIVPQSQRSPLPFAR